MLLPPMLENDSRLSERVLSMEGNMGGSVERRVVAHTKQ